MREKNRAASVAMKAEIRRTKARLLEDAQKLQKLALKKVLFLLKKNLSCFFSTFFFMKLMKLELDEGCFFFFYKKNLAVSPVDEKL